jgi:hypothetical protein
VNRRDMQERRITPRVGARVPIQLSESETSQLLTTESMNLSKSGISCRTSEFVAPLAKVDLTMILPPFGNLTKASRVLRAEGVVVRCEPVVEEESGEKTSEFDVACYFTTLEEDSRNLLDAFVAWKLLRTARADQDRTAASPMAGRRVAGTKRMPRTARSGSGPRRPAGKPTDRKPAGRGHGADRSTPRPGEKSSHAPASRTGRAADRKSWGGKSDRNNPASRPRQTDRKPTGGGGHR